MGSVEKYCVVTTLENLRFFKALVNYILFNISGFPIFPLKLVFENQGHFIQNLSNLQYLSGQ